MWLMCYTQEEIADAVDVTQKTIDNWIEDFSNFASDSKITKIARFDDDFTPPLFNVWTKAKKSNDVEHFGNTESSFTDNYRLD